MYSNFILHQLKGLCVHLMRLESLQKQKVIPIYHASNLRSGPFLERSIAIDRLSRLHDSFSDISQTTMTESNSI